MHFNLTNYTNVNNKVQTSKKESSIKQHYIATIIILNYSDLPSIYYKIITKIEALEGPEMKFEPLSTFRSNTSLTNLLVGTSLFKMSSWD